MVAYGHHPIAMSLCTNESAVTNLMANCMHTTWVVTKQYI